MSPAREAAWLQKADNDLLAADNNLAASRVPFDAVCFHCQQAAEKSLKGLLVFLGTEAPRTHDLLAVLERIKLLLSSDIEVKVRDACIVLNPYAIEIRYPDEAVFPTVEDAGEAREAAGVVVQWVRSLMQRTR